MISFCIHFLFCNLFLGIILGAMLFAKRLFGKYLSGCSQYRIWYLLPFLLTAPFLSIRPAGFSEAVLWLRSLQNTVLPDANTTASLAAAGPLSSAGWINDFQLSVTRSSVSAAGYIPFVLWVCGMLAMTVFMIKSKIRLYQIEQSALPLQNRNVRLLYEACRTELGIKRNIPIFSTAFLKSPVIVGMLRPRIYLPIHLISGMPEGYFKETDLRYMLLHELQHYKHKDAFLNGLLNVAIIVYWFNPVVWLVLKEARTDREVACDTFVLQMLKGDDYVNYGNTLLLFAQKISLSPFSAAVQMGGSKKQIQKRILNIAEYRPKSRLLKLKEYLVFTVLIALTLEAASQIPVLASDTRISLPKEAVIHTEDLSGYFADCEGCFVLYDSGADTWDIYNETLAATRFSPYSTYKPYSALFALEHRLITPDASALAWDGSLYSFPAWNRDQTLSSAMQDSVNWYFQELDRQADFDALQQFYQTIGYGNCDLSGGVSEFWLESSLKISAFEQVELLKKLYENAFHFDSRNVQAVKDSIKLSAEGASVLSGKTGTGVINGESVHGWFIGSVESDTNTWFFAANIQRSTQAGSLTASEITRNILADKHIYPMD